jgi:uncharacterized NAD(P)/FAD-binding protein YdhS
MSRARPDFRVIIVERGRRLGRGVAYGACAPRHLLNVPVSRMEVGLTPGFADWLQATPAARGALDEALDESDGDLATAFVPRALFGDYMQARVTEALTTGPGAGLAAVRGEAVGLLAPPRRGAHLADGREIEADIVVLATGNFAPRAPGGADPWLYDHPAFIPDPWAPEAFDGVAGDDPVLLLGTGLTMVDVALRLNATGHHGPILAVSRRGLVPETHAGGGTWPAFLGDALPASPVRLLRVVRQQVAAAQAQGTPWQRVFDAARPAVATVWRQWSLVQRRQFLRRLRPRWDVLRHRMAPRIASALAGMVDAGLLETVAAGVRGYRIVEGGEMPRVEATLKPRGGAERAFVAAWVVNCTGPRRDVATLGTPLFADLRDRGLALPDELGLGLETDDAALLDGVRRASDWLFALGPLTCPSWWEIVAVPEIAVQVGALVNRIASGDIPRAGDHPLSPVDFLDLGAGI